MKIYCSSYCNQAHRVDNGKPVGHGCRVLLPAALKAEIDGNIEKANELLSAERNPKFMIRGTKPAKEQP